MDEDRSINEVEKTFEQESAFYLESSSELNMCIDHIVSLLVDARILFDAGSYARTISLAIVTLEEVGKTQIALFTHKPESEYVKHDPLRDHKTKQIIGSNYTISMGTRLVEAIGEEMLEHIYSLSYDGKLKTMREQMLYWDRDSGNILLPEKIANYDFAKALLLFAIESFDDNLVGWTNHSMEISRDTDKMFEEIVSS